MQGVGSSLAILLPKNKKVKNKKNVKMIKLMKIIGLNSKGKSSISTLLFNEIYYSPQC